MAGGIFLIKNDDELVKMDEKAYDSEAVLQELLAKYPDLLAGDQINKDDPRRWLLIIKPLGSGLSLLLWGHVSGFREL